LRRAVSISTRTGSAGSSIRRRRLGCGPDQLADDERDIGPGKNGIDVLSEIDTQWDVIDIPEYGSGTVLSDKTIEYPPGDRGGIITSIRNCYPCHLTNLRIV
jgi:hypothetical protein